jgi:hypothetical protein
VLGRNPVLIVKQISKKQAVELCGEWAVAAAATRGDLETMFRTMLECSRASESMVGTRERGEAYGRAQRARGAPPGNARPESA